MVSRDTINHESFATAGCHCPASQLASSRVEPSPKSRQVTSWLMNCCRFPFFRSRVRGCEAFRPRGSAWIEILERDGMYQKLPRRCLLFRILSSSWPFSGVTLRYPFREDALPMILAWRILVGYFWIDRSRSDNTVVASDPLSGSSLHPSNKPSSSSRPILQPLSDD